MKLKYIKLSGKLKELGWLTDTSTVSENLEAITHEIAHIVSLKCPIKVMNAKEIDNLLNASIEKSKQDENEFIASAITKEVLQRLGIFTMGDVIAESLINNIFLSTTIKELVGDKYKKHSTNRNLLESKAAIKCEKLKQTSEVQHFADQIIEYYDEILDDVD